MGRALGLAIAVAAIDVKRIVKIPAVFILMLLYVFCVYKGMRKKSSVMIWKQIIVGNSTLYIPVHGSNTLAGILVTLTL
jgi:hypothetical protein